VRTYSLYHFRSLGAAFVVGLMTATMVLLSGQLSAQCQPTFTSSSEDLSVDCGGQLPPLDDCAATSDCCEGPVEVNSFTSETGALLSDCVVSTAMGPGVDWAVWLPMIDAPSVAWNFIGDGHFQIYGDGTARVWGVVANAANPMLQLEVEMWLENGTNWEGWSAQGRMFKNDLGFAGTNYFDWQYFELVAGFSRLTGVGELEGTLLELHHQPADYFYGFQSGIGANNKNGNDGMSGWFTYEGQYDGETVSGHGDINVNQDCEIFPEGCATTAFTRVCRAEDSCGNIAFQAQTVSVTDDEAPAVNPFEEVITVPCFEAQQIYITATDACSTVIISFEDEVVVAGCPGIVIRHYLVSDACGNAVEVSQTINILSEGELEFTIFPEDTSAECDEVASLNPLVEWNAVCANTELSISENIIPGECPNSYTVEYTYTLTDGCGNQVSQIWTVEVSDTTPPVFFDVPQGITINCGTDIPQALPFAVDNCGEVNVTLEAVTEQLSCGYNFIRTWTALDQCGNSTVATQTIYVSDNVDPFFTFLPPSVIVECDEPYQLDLALFEDACSEVELSWTDVPLGDCAGSYLRLWRAFDGCGNQALESTTVTIIDNAAPVMTSFPENITVNCGDVPAIEEADIEFEDFCTAVEVDFEETIGEGDCAGGYTIFRTWTLTDDCNNSSVWTWEISVSDNQPPVLVGVPEDATLSCGDIIPDAVVEAIDNCDDNLQVSLNAETIQNECGFLFVRTWTAVDDCGNLAQASQTITLEDTAPPVFTFVPADLNITCDGSTPNEQNPAEAEDNCSEVTVTFTDEVTAGGCAGGFIRLWIATDGCGNFVTAEQQITSSDQADPVITSFPEDVTVSCDQIPSVEDALVEYSDDCGNVLVTLDENIIPGTCPNSYTIERTWTFTDGCGNSVSDTWNISVVDEQGPLVFGVPDNTTISCGQEIEDAVVSAIDNCSAPENITISLNAVTEPTECGYEFIRTWTVTDECNNSTTLSQVVTVTDNAPPVFTFVPGDIEVICGEDYVLEDPIATDDCSEVTISVSTGDGSACIGGLVRVFTATDGCGNTATAQQIITIDDQTPPVAVNAPDEALFFNCDDFLEVTEDYVQFEDACSNVSVLFEEFFVPSDCPGSYSIFYSWTASDDCGNLSQEIMEVFYVDQTPPQFTIFPEDLFLNCGDEIPEPNVVAVDDCSEVTITVDDEPLGNGCSSQLVRTITASDACGNFVSNTQLITFVDQNAPVFINSLSDITVSCDEVVPVPVYPLIEDDCTFSDVTLSESIVDGECPNTYTIIRTFTASDLCGNTVSQIQNVFVVDDQAPVFEDYTPQISVDCGQSNGVFVTASDNCNATTITFTDALAAGVGCGGAIIRTYTATDACGNSSEIEQFISLNDNEAPVFISFPEDGDLACDEVPSQDDVVIEFTDNCSEVSVDYNEVVTPGSCPNNYVMARTWTITDDCGNSNSQTWTINVTDTEAPSIIGVPEDETLDCSDAIPAVAVFAFDNCTAEPLITLTATQEVIGCNTLFTRRWNAEDECGNMSQEIQVITISDFFAPVLSDTPGDIILFCGEDIPAPAEITAVDNCVGDVPVDFTQTGGNNGGCTTITRTWCASDCVGNEVCHTQNIFFVDGISAIQVWQQSDANAVIRVTPEVAGRWNVDVYDVNGKIVSNVFSGDMLSDRMMTFDLNIANIGTGVYYVRFSNGEIMESKGFGVIR
jgi:large repetitive protein